MRKNHVHVPHRPIKLALVPSEDTALERVLFNKNTQEIIKKSEDGVIIVDPNRNVRFLNPSAQNYLGKQLINQSFSYPLIPGQKTEIDIYLNNTTSGIGEMTVVEIDWEGDKAYLVSLRDITSRKKQEKDLRGMALFQELNPNPVFRVDRYFNITVANTAAQEIFGENIVGKKSWEVSPFLDSKTMEETFEKGRQQLEIQIREKLFLLDCRFCGGYDFFQIYGADITARRKAEKVSVHAEKLSTIGQMSAGVAHEINNPLGVIMGFAEVLASRIDPKDKLAIPIRNILRESHRCKEFVQNLLTFSRSARQDRKHPMNFNAAVQEALSLVLARGKMTGVELVLDLDSNIPTFYGNLSQIQQIVVNLGNNAIDSMPEGGILEVKTHLIEKKSQKNILLKITDSGNGISEKIQKTIFEPFFTTKEVGKGTGLGLSLISEIIENHDGKIDLKSKPGQGSSFSVYLPFPEQPFKS